MPANSTVDEDTIFTFKTTTVEEGDSYRINRVYFSSSKYPTPERIQLEFNTYCEHPYSPCGCWYKTADYVSLEHIKGDTYCINVTYKQNI
jgi:hypothetical protein